MKKHANDILGWQGNLLAILTGLLTVQMDKTVQYIKRNNTVQSINTNNIRCNLSIQIIRCNLSIQIIYGAIYQYK